MTSDKNDPPSGPWGPFGSSGNGSEEKKTSAPNGGNPWRQGGGGRGGSPFNQEPPDFGEMFRKFSNLGAPLKPKGHVQAVVMAVGVLLGLWLLSGFYQVSPNQLGVVMRFGAFARTENAGLRYHWPMPIEEVLLPDVTAQNEIQIGFRRSKRTDDIRPVPQESLMLTQDENVIDVGFAVLWRISDISKFLFEIRDPERTIKMAAESAMREVIGQNKLQFALTDGRSQIAEEARKRLQALVDEYDAGILVTQINLQNVSVPEEVKQAFQDVVNARLEQERMQNDAAKHVNEVIPAANGEASQIKQQAIAYRDQKIAIAQGEAQRFKEVYAAYAGARDVTAKRMYLETMEAVLGNANKVVMDKAVGSVPMFPLQNLLNAKTDGAKNDGAKK